MPLFEVWESDDGEVVETTLVPQEEVEKYRRDGLLGANPVLLRKIEADTWRDALTLHYKGFEVRVIQAQKRMNDRLS